MKLGVLAGVILAVEITAAGMRTDLQKVDCIVVPGARSEQDGTPGPSYRARLDRAVELYREGWAPWLVCTGGQGASGPIESHVGRDYAIARGVPADHILVEEHSHDTWENFHYAAEVMGERKSCLVVTDPFHSQRCCWIARDVGLAPHPAPTARNHNWLLYTLRECASTLVYFGERLTTRRPQ